MFDIVLVIFSYMSIYVQACAMLKMFNVVRVDIVKTKIIQTPETFALKNVH